MALRQQLGILQRSMTRPSTGRSIQLNDILGMHSKPGEDPAGFTAGVLPAQIDARLNSASV